MDVDYVLYIAPLLPLLLALEVGLAHLQKRSAFRLSDSLANLCCGLFEEAAMLLAKGLLFAPYLYLYKTGHLASLELKSPVGWAIAFFGIDFLYYWWHRSAHRINAMWALHSAHHQSREYNLTVGLRQEFPLTEWAFYLPLAVLGVQPELFLLVYSFTQLYQLPIHTRLIGRLGFLERVLNTPSHHRVHHGTDAAYVDKNYGAVLIIWDKLFGTFQREDAEPHYGLVHPLGRWSLLNAHFGYLAYLVRTGWDLRWHDKVRLWLLPPSWQPPGMRVQVQAAPTEARQPLAGYALVTLLALIPVGAWLLSNDEAPRLAFNAALGFVLSTTLLLTLWLDGMRWAAYLEPLRLVAALGFTGYLFYIHDSVAWVWGAGLFVQVVGSLALRVVRQHSPFFPTSATHVKSAGMTFHQWALSNWTPRR